MATSVDQGLYRDVIGRFASGVTVVTTRADKRDFGTTASAVSSLSMQPPMLLICLNRTSETQAAILQSKRFVVNVLAEGQEEVAKRFATKAASKFEAGEVVRSHKGLPMVQGALAHLECTVAETATGGTHTVFLSEVEQADASDGGPLTYYRGRFGRFDELVQESAYRDIRTLVIRRQLPVSDPFDVTAVADALKLESPSVLYALTKLISDGLVERDLNGLYSIRPMDISLADQALEACCAIQVAVVDALAEKGIPEERLAELQVHVDECVAAVERDPPDLHLLRVASGRFQQKFAALLGNELLVDAFRRLGIEGIWLRALGRDYLSPLYLVELMRALRDRDGAEAKRIIYAFTEEGRRIAAAAIARAGGSL